MAETVVPVTNPAEAQRAAGFTENAADSLAGIAARFRAEAERLDKVAADLRTKAEAQDISGMVYAPEVIADALSWAMNNATWISYVESATKMGAKASLYAVLAVRTEPVEA